MKKENRKMAQQLRAEQRRKEEQSQKIRKGLACGIPLVLILILIVAIIVSHVQESKEAETEETVETEIVLSTDTDLAVADGDTVNIDYVGTIDGVEFEGGNTNGSGADLTIGSGRYIDDFEEQLIGHKVGETVEVVVTFPENYGNEDLNGKEAVFTTTINGIYESVAVSDEVESEMPGADGAETESESAEESESE